ncbi:MAG: hypothetical protein ACXV8U_12930 [Methylobacter sp.]
MEKLLPSLDKDSVFLRMVQEGELSIEDKDRCYFEILKREVSYPPLNITHFQTFAEQVIGFKEQQTKGEWVDVPYDLKVVKLSKPTTYENSSISETERQTMLKLIVGMAIDAYGYNPDATKNKATGENRGSIKAALDKLVFNFNNRFVY